MPTSQNGYPANDPSLMDVIDVPGSRVRFRVRRGPVAKVFAYLAARIDDEVEDIDEAGSYSEDARPNIDGSGPSDVFDDWSYAERPIRGSSTTLSNHASGTAIDVNATQHPLGVRGTWTRVQISRVRNILDDLRDPATGRCVIRWGEDYSSRPDGMHFEINESESAVARVAARLSTPTGSDAEDGENGMAFSAEAERRLDELETKLRTSIGNHFALFEEVYGRSAGRGTAATMLQRENSDEPPKTLGGLLYGARLDARESVEVSRAMQSALENVATRLAALEAKVR